MSKIRMLLPFCKKKKEKTRVESALMVLLTSVIHVVGEHREGTLFQGTCANLQARESYR